MCIPLKLPEVDKQNRGAHGFTSLEDLSAWKRDEFEWKLTAERTHQAQGPEDHINIRSFVVSMV